MRSLVCSVLFTFAAVVLLSAGSIAGDPPEKLEPVEKLKPEEKKEKTEPQLPKLKPLVPADPKQTDDKNKKPGDETEPDAGKLPEDPAPLEKLEDKSKPEDPKKVMARIASNMETVEGLLKKGETGDETQQMHQKIIEDLEKLLQQSQEQKNKGSKGSKGEKKQSKNKNQQSKNKSGGANQPKNGPGQGQKKQQNQGKSQGKAKPGLGKKSGKSQAKPKPAAKPGKAKTNKTKIQVAQAKKDNKDGKALNLKLKDGKKDVDDKNKSTLGKLFKDVWGHYPKKKRMELDSYSNEQFMPQYEQLLRQYYSNIAKHSRSKKGGG